MSTSAGRVLIIPKGEYSAGTTYEMLDLVRFGKGTFVCKKTSAGNEPSFDADTEYWQLVATSGDVSGVKGNAEATYRNGNVNITYDNLGGVDSALSSSSEMPIQNKVVKGALDLKLDDPGYDDAPTAYSTKLVNSGNIKTALDAKLSADGDSKNNITTFRSVDDASILSKTNSGITTGGRNYLPNNLVSATADGLDFTRNANGTITVDGEATGTGTKEIANYTLKAGTYIVTDGDNNGMVEILDDSSTKIADTAEANQEFTLAADAEITAQITYTSGDVIDNLTLYPMIRLSTDTDTTFEMYYTTTPALVSGDTHRGLFAKISAMFANIRKLWNTVGETDISSIGQTVTGAISNIAPILLWANESPNNSFTSQYVDVPGIQSYREIIVEFGRANQSYGQARYTIRTGITYVMSAIANNYIYGDYREFIIRDNQVGFADGYYGKPSGSPMPVANDAAIPKFIYGIK